ncbi:flagellar basal body rod protein FlgF [Pseudomonas fragi]|jgi:flagellar basal-body rod protein FlgF|uniref:flagellar basal body rod protein FlgF n=1 Tax=Pseudomonas fragi TaxID=296 RepID=UPI0002E09BCF|nr:flagellar basal body rod protein FlgF [Pseudomonas fragi]ARQ74659.1 flagellar biosynthesis protein FlgF [Pseudomonas fragi]MDE4515333.1 flagellar basal body rod protein FlgF [Pseudomonas fragi]NNA83983.1 flagellar basal body rod protein FlgF [Pseudomonas fragi]NNB01446.1 flagellar basal body rod protein FlgF [Pseudomonas fragi]NNB12425.1 flagellar basal body rod protein FlgF [Pseudomonas fragi]
MDRLGYTAMTAASRTMTALDVRANNLANVNTPGFRSDLEQSASVAVQGYGYDSRHLAHSQGNGVSLAPGALMATGRDMDFAIKGPGLIAVQGPEGEAYTRHGSLQVDADMQLTLNGRAVLGEGGPIVLPQFDSIRIAGDGRISVLPRGEPLMVEIDQIKLVDVPAGQLSKDSAGLLVTRNGVPAATDDNVQLVSGFLEASNVSAIDQLVGTMSLSRLFETQVKMMKAAEDLSTSGNSLMRGN